MKTTLLHLKGASLCLERGKFGLKRGTFAQFAKKWGAMASLASRFLRPFMFRRKALELKNVSERKVLIQES